MRDNVSLNNILWYDVYENGYINGYVKNKASIYIFMETCDERRCYIGSSVKLVNRFNSHRSRINSWGKNNSQNGSPLFYNSVLKYGWKKFKFGVEYIDLPLVTDTINKSILLEREQFYLNKINPSLNICKTAGSPLGIVRNKMFSVNVSKAKRGKKIVKSIININTTHKVITSETRSKLSSRAEGVIVKIYNSNNLLYIFPSMASAAKHFGVSYKTISRILKTGISYVNFVYKF